MFSPAEAIAELDRALAAVGEDVVYHVMTGGVAAAGLPVRALVRGFEPADLIGGISQKDRKVTISPTDLAALPAEGSRLVIAGKACRIQAAEGILMAGVLVRLNLVARG